MQLQSAMTMNISCRGGVYSSRVTKVGHASESKRGIYNWGMICSLDSTYIISRVNEERIDTILNIYLYL